MRDLPVLVDLPERLAAEVTAFVERAAGWQRVPPAGPPCPLLALAAAPVAGLATVVVVEGPPGSDAVRAALLAGALDVVAWPAERERVLAAAARLPLPAAAGTPPALLVGGAAGGVGASTTALALAGLLAWSGRRTVALGGPGLVAMAGVSPWTGPAAAELRSLDPGAAAAEFATVARPVPGVPGLWVLRDDGAGPGPGWPVDVAVVDLGALHAPSSPADSGNADTGRAPRAPDVVVARADRSLERARELGRPAVVAGDGPADAAGVRRMLAAAPLCHLPYSLRVARAALAGRVPAGLPGTYLRPLAGALGRLRPGAAT